MSTEKQETLTSVEITEAVVTFDFYSCEEAVKRLNDYLDHELDATERADVLKHLALCKPCLERFTFEETLIVSIKQKVRKYCAPTQLKSRLSELINRR